MNTHLLLTVIIVTRPCQAFTVLGGGQVTVHQGRAATISCQADTFYEFCSFR